MSRATHHASHIGQILLGKYRIERVLGEGGMGLVLAVRHIDLGQLFAIKLMLPSALADHSAVERFLREARAAAQLRSEHVARVHDVGRLADATPFMVMEHLAGQDLKQFLRERGSLPPEEAATYIYQACKAIAEAHSLGIVHRDLKPANLFLTRRPDDSPCVKVLDFGISKELDAQGKVGSDLTKTGMLIGSPHYMSPEQMTRSKEADTRSDIWSLGVILFEFLTGKRPFVADTMMELVASVVTMDPSRPSELAPHISPELEIVVLKCLERHREQRFQSVNELMAALRPFVAGQWAPMTPPSGALPISAARAKDSEDRTDLGMQTTKARFSSSRREVAPWKIRIAVAALALLALLAAGGAWISLGRGVKTDAKPSVESPSQAIQPVRAEAPALTVLPAPTSEPAVRSSVPSASAAVSAYPTMREPKPRSPRPTATAVPPPQATSAQPISSSTSKVPRFDD